MTDSSNNPADDLYRKLEAADPIDPQTLPSPQDPEALHILENAMFQTPNEAHGEIPNNQPTARPMSAQVPREITDPVDPSQFQFDHSSKPSRRGRGMLVGAAAAVLLLVGGLLVLSPDNTPSAVAAVHGAASATLDADTARITTDFTVEGTDGVESGTASGRFTAAYANDDLLFTIDADSLQFDGPEDAPSVDDLPVTEARLVDDVLYVDTGEGWIAVDTDGLLGEIVNRFADPRQVLETVQEITETTEVGEAEVDGVTTTHYQSVIDLGDESLAQSGWLPFEGMPVDSEDGEITVDLFVDNDGVMRQLNLSGDVEDTATDGGSGTFEVVTRFTDIGSDISIEAPEDVEVLDPFQSLVGED